MLENITLGVLCTIVVLYVVGMSHGYGSVSFGKYTFGSTHMLEKSQ